MILTSFLTDSIGLPSVLQHLEVDKVDDVGPNGSPEHRWQGDIRLARLILVRIDSNQRSGSGL